MALVKLSEASRLVGKSDKTLYRHISQKRLSVTLDESGQKVIDTSELMRVYGALRNNEGQNILSMPLDEKHFEMELRIENASLKAENEGLKALNQETSKRVELLTYTEKKNKSKTWLWVSLGVIIAVLATNLAYKIPSPF